jgi:type IV pilus assembly protein PilM
MLINNPFAGAFGLDIGDSSIKLVRLEKIRHPNLSTYYEVSDIRQIALPPGCVASGEILQSELVREKIRLLLSHQKGISAIKSPWVVADLPVTKSFLKLIRVNATANDVRDEIVRFEASKHLPLDMSDMVVDWQIIEDHETPTGTTPILIGAAPKKLVTAYYDLLVASGLTPLAIEIEDLSIARALITANKDYEGQARAILDLGGSRASLIIFDKGSIQFSSLINFSGDYIDTALIQRLKIDRTVAEELKNNYGLNYVDEYPEYLKIMTELTEKLVENIYQISLFYRDHFYKPNPITHITMSGGLSNMINLDRFLADKLQTETAPGNVWKNLHNNHLEQEGSTGLALASAIGLALRAADWPSIKKHL